MFIAFLEMFGAFVTPALPGLLCVCIIIAGFSAPKRNTTEGISKRWRKEKGYTNAKLQYKIFFRIYKETKDKQKSIEACESELKKQGYIPVDIYDDIFIGMKSGKMLIVGYAEQMFEEYDGAFVQLKRNYYRKHICSGTEEEFIYSEPFPKDEDEYIKKYKKYEKP